MVLGDKKSSGKCEMFWNSQAVADGRLKSASSRGCCFRRQRVCNSSMLSIERFLFPLDAITFLDMNLLNDVIHRRFIYIHFVLGNLAGTLK
mmetsp:Transcript_25178/g.35159  ORF Transcript_25178/g.35159 Transcript_25178/m.35159 type:complete len:91 (+) Transcript_25178:381-653(+)